MAPAFSRQLLSIASIAIVLAAGCGQAVPFNKNVEGVATLDGKPLANVHVRFVPAADENAALPVSYGVTDESGKFKMLADKRPGAAITKHKVVFLQGRTTDRTSERTQQSGVALDVIVPAHYSDAKTTPLEADVTADKHLFEFQLTSQGR